MADDSRCARIVRGRAERLRIAITRQGTLTFRTALCTLIVVGTAEPAYCGAARLARPVMGTVLEVTVIANDDGRARVLAEQAFAIVEHWEQVLTNWRTDGELAEFNAQAGEGPQHISGDLTYALERMLALERKTRGAFDPAVGSIVLALRSGRTTIPTDEGTRGLRNVLRMGSGTAELLGGTQLDAGGIGKGIALDAVAGMLAREGADAWFLNFGGSSQLAHGRPEANREWLIGVAALRLGRVHGTLALKNASLSTSRAMQADEASGTIIDPRSGMPVTSARTATVVTADAASGDAWSTALIVLGRNGVDTARAEGVEVLYEDESGVVMTPGFPLDGRPAPRSRARSLRPRSPS